MASKQVSVSCDSKECLIDEPLDTLEIKVNSKNGIQKTVSALHIGFMETRHYVHFKTPPAASGDTEQEGLSAEEEEWLECMSFLEDDLHWLLKLPHHRFWSQVVFDEKLHCCLESYLSLAPRDYDFVNIFLKDEVLCVLKKIHKLVFLVFLRMSTFKESKKHHIRPHAFGEILYENFLFDIPKIMDLCVLYGIRNRPLLSRMVENIFTTQPKYLDDLNETSGVVIAAFNSAEEKLFLNASEKHDGLCKLEGNTASGIKELPLETIYDVIHYITDTSSTIYSFLEIWPQACQMFHQNGATIRIATFYEQVFPSVEKEIKKRSESSEFKSLIEDAKRKLILSKTYLIKTFRNLLSYCCIQHVLNEKYQQENASAATMYAESFLEIFTEIAVEVNFLHDYNILFPFETDLELFVEVGLHLDPERLDYIFCSIHDDSEKSKSFAPSNSNGARPKAQSKKRTGTAETAVKNLHSVAALLEDDALNKDGSDNATFGNGKSYPSSNHITSVQSVREVLPTLGEGFIEKCLEYYSCDPEKVIHAVLNDSLPDTLSHLDRDLKSERKNDENVSDENGILSQRKNVFDNDEFDMFRRDVNLENVHIGKKQKTPSTYQALESDADSEFIKQFTLNYGAEETEYREEFDIYEDEYDDTYDSMMVGLKEPATEIESVKEKEEPVEDKRDEEGQANSSQREPQPGDFCINPEILRERANQRRQAKAERHGRGAGTPSSDNQSKHQKERHKAQSSNHSRRKQSDFKRSRGMGLLPPR